MFDNLCFRDLYLDGNDLLSEGVIHLIAQLSDFAEIEAKEREINAIQREEAKEREKAEKQKNSITGRFGELTKLLLLVHCLTGIFHVV